MGCLISGCVAYRVRSEKMGLDPNPSRSTCPLAIAHLLQEREIGRSGQLLTTRLLQAREVLMEESNVQPVRCPVTVCGDIHGQFVSSSLSSPLSLPSNPPTTACHVRGVLPLCTLLWAVSTC
jgi:hypothetical protein